MSMPVTAGSQRVKVFSWCLPKFYLDNLLGGQTISVAVHVDLANQADEAPNVDLSEIFATMAWGSSTGDNRGGPDCQEVDFDVIQGSSLTVEASSLTVYLTYPGPADLTHPPVLVDVSVGVGTSGKAGISSSAQRTILTTPATVPGGGGSSLPQPIPQWSDSAILINTDPAIPTAVLRQYNGNLLVSAATIGKGSVDTVPIARGRGARFFDILNTNAADSPNTAVIFGLCPD